MAINKVIKYKAEAGEISFRSPQHLKLKQAKALTKLQRLETDDSDIDIDELIDALKALCETDKDKELIEEMTLAETEEAFKLWGDSVGKTQAKKNTDSSS